MPGWEPSFASRKRNSFDANPIFLPGNLPLSRNSNMKKLTIACDEPYMKSNATFRNIALPRRSLQRQTRGLSTSRQGPDYPRGYQRNHPEEYKCRPERVVIDQPSSHQAKDHSSNSRPHASESPDGSHSSLRKHISRN